MIADAFAEGAPAGEPVLSTPVFSTPVFSTTEGPLLEMVQVTIAASDPSGNQTLRTLQLTIPDRLTAGDVAAALGAVLALVLLLGLFIVPALPPAHRLTAPADQRRTAGATSIFRRQP